MTAPRGAARPPSEPERRSFTARTPVNGNPDQVAYRHGFVTRHQVSGWRFVMRRIASGVALHDTRMLVDPLRAQSRAVLVGALILITGLTGCFVFSLIRPSGVVGDNAILAERSTAALYVRIDEQLHPVLNLTSARLIVGRPDSPATVKGSELDRLPRGNLVGIPGAPERMVQNATRDAEWTVCEAVSGSSSGVTVIAGPLGGGGERARTLPADHAALVKNDAGVWLLWDGRRSPIDLTDRAVTDALGLARQGFGTIPPPRPIAAGLFNAIPEAPALRAPVIRGAGESAPYPLPVTAPVGSVVAAFDSDNTIPYTIRYYAVLSDGLQPISPVLAAIMRNADSFGLAQPPRLGADDVTRLPVGSGIDTAAYPAERITLIDAGVEPVTCVRWAQPADAPQNSLTLLAGAALPLPDGTRTLDLVGAGGNGVADGVAMSPGTGYLVQTAGVTAPGSSLFWLSDAGVRYGIDTTGEANTLAVLGLESPAVPIPPVVLAQFAAGPTLSRTDALLAHDALAADPHPVRLEAP